MKLTKLTATTALLMSAAGMASAEGQVDLSLV